MLLLELLLLELLLELLELLLELLLLELELLLLLELLVLDPVPPELPPQPTNNAAMRGAVQTESRANESRVRFGSGWFTCCSESYMEYSPPPRGGYGATTTKLNRAFAASLSGNGAEPRACHAMCAICVSLLRADTYGRRLLWLEAIQSEIMSGRRRNYHPTASPSLR